MNQIERKWAEAEAVLERNGIGRGQLEEMRKAFFAGAYGCADVLREGFNESADPDVFAGLLARVMGELLEARRRDREAAEAEPGNVIRLGRSGRN